MRIMLLEYMYKIEAHLAEACISFCCCSASLLRGSHLPFLNDLNMCALFFCVAFSSVLGSFGPVLNATSLLTCYECVLHFESTRCVYTLIGQLHLGSCGWLTAATGKLRMYERTYVYVW